MNSKLSKIKTEYYLSIKVENISDKIWVEYFLLIKQCEGLLSF